MTWELDPFQFSDNAHDIDIERVFSLLKATYWSDSRPLQTIERMIDHSMCFTLLLEERQIGFVRVISDYTTTSWIADMVVDEAFRGRGLGKWMMTCLMRHPRLSHTQLVLQAKDAHHFYERLGFERRSTLMSTPVDYLQDAVE